MTLTKNDDAWNKLFAKYNILNRINKYNFFHISANQIKPYREPRLMAKFDHSINLPQIFSKNHLGILPISRGDYIIAPFNAYHKLENGGIDSTITRMFMPDYIQSIDKKGIFNETVALNCAAAAGILSDFTSDSQLTPTIEGRMGSGEFQFHINSLSSSKPLDVSVSNSQVEIDGAYEGLDSLCIFEAKNSLSDDFIIRQLYYPFRTCKNLVIKPIRPIFMVYSNSIFHLYEYKFSDWQDYNSIQLIKHKKYSLEDTSISPADIQNTMDNTAILSEPTIPFPQADKFSRIINLCELVHDKPLSRAEITSEYAFDERQTSYYTDAARYLGLLRKEHTDGEIVYSLTQEGKRILHLNFKHRQLALCAKILSHNVFNRIFHLYLRTHSLPSRNQIVEIMKSCNLYKIESESTFKRRSSTVIGWINWIRDLVQ
jgi:hypothetical protein